MNRLMAGNLAIELAWLDIGRIVETTVQGFQLAAGAKGLRLDWVIESPQIAVLGDARRLQQVLSNLLHNAVTFTPRGGRIGVHVGEVDGQVTITVQDNGGGIHRDFLPHVFERFRQQDASTTRESPGLGLASRSSDTSLNFMAGRSGHSARVRIQARGS